MKRAALLALLLLPAISCRQEAPTEAPAATTTAAAASATTAAENANDPIRIIEPRDGAAVPHRAIVRGTVREAQGPPPVVWVVVRPMSGNIYWVQPRVDVDRGSWSVQVYIGLDEMSHRGEHFKIAAVLNPRTELREQMKLPDWPEAEARSNIVEVIKK